MMRYLVLVALFAVRGAAADVLLPPLPVASSVVARPAGRSLQAAEAQMLNHSLVAHKGAFDLRFINVGQLVDLLYDDALNVPHVIASDVLSDSRVVSFQFDTSKGDLRAFVLTFLDSLGFKVETKDGVDFVMVKPEAAKPEVDRDVYVYRVKFRRASELASMVESMFGAQRAMSSASAAASSGAAASAPGPAPSSSAAMGAPLSEGKVALKVTAGSTDDELVVSGSAHDVSLIKKLLPDLDTQVGEVVVRGWAYEVDDSSGTNSGFSIASKLFGVGVSVGSGSTVSDPNAFQFDAGRLSAAISALRSDSRFKEVSSPNVRCVSGQQVKLNVGQQVPTEGAVSYQGVSGTPVQSVDYQDAGVIFNVMPTVMGDMVQLKVDEEISSFVSTTTGVNSSPTKNTRSLQTVADLKDGEVILLGGLVQDQDSVSSSSEGFLPRFLDGHSKSKARTEVVLVLQVQKI